MGHFTGCSYFPNYISYSFSEVFTVHRDWMEEQVNALVEDFQSREEKLQSKINNLNRALRDKSGSKWTQEMSINNLIDMNESVVEWYKIACYIKGVEALLSEDSAVYEPLRHLRTTFLSYLRKINLFGAIFAFYEENGIFKHRELQLYNSMQSRYQTAHAMLDESYKWILTFKLPQRNIFSPTKGKKLARAAKSLKAHIASVKFLPDFSEENSARDKLCSKSESALMDLGLNRGIDHNQLVEEIEDWGVNEENFNSHNLKKECKLMSKDLEQIKQANEGGWRDVRMYIGAAKYFADRMNVIAERKNWLSFWFGLMSPEFLTSYEWKSVEYLFDIVLEDFANKCTEYAIHRRDARSKQSNMPMDIDLV